MRKYLMGNETIGMMFLVLKDIAWLATTVKDDMTTGKLLVEQMVLTGKSYMLSSTR